MFGSVLLDVALGVILTFLVVSLLASAVTEGISALLELRHRTLRQGVQALLNDPKFTGLARDLYNHALISPFGSGMVETVGKLVHPPAYIEPRQFGTALLDVLSTKTSGPTTDDMIEAITDPQLKRTVQALQDRATRLGTHLSDELATWFDASMDRVGGWYKRQAQWISFWIALVLAAALNADAIHVAASLWDRPAVAAHVAEMAKRPTPPGMIELLTELEANNSLIGWPENATMPTTTGWALRLLGWALTAAATLFGAAFWFDLLQRIVQVRATGATPDEKKRAQ